MKKLNTIILSAVLLSSLSLSAQKQVIRTGCYEISGQDQSYINGLVATPDSGFILGGWAGKIGSSTFNDGYIMKVDKEFKKQWVKSNGNVNADITRDIAIQPDGRFAVLMTVPNFDWQLDGQISLYDSSGNQISAKGFGTASVDNFRAMCATRDGGYVAVGFADTDGAFGLAIKVDKDGKEVWSARIGSYFRLFITAVTEAPDSGILMAGSARGVSGSLDAVVLKLDKYGNPLWSKGIGSADVTEDFYGIANYPGGGFVAAGRGFGPQSIGSHGFMVRYNDDGEVIWQVTLKSSENDIFRSVAVDNEGNIIAAGFMEPQNTENDRGIISMLKGSDGSLLWTKTYTIEGKVSDFNKVSLTLDKGIVAAGNYGNLAIQNFKRGFVSKLGISGEICAECDVRDTVTTRSVSQYDTSSSALLKLGTIEHDRSVLSSSDVEVLNMSGETVWCGEDIPGFITLPSAEMLTLFPNPVSHYIITRNLPDGIFNYYISDMSGKEILRGQIQSGQIIGLENLPGGFYIFGIESPDYRASLKFIKL